MKKLFLLPILAFAFFIPKAQAQYGLLINCQLTTATGQAVPGATVYVLDQPANTTNYTPQASVYTSTTGGAATQPLTTNGLGQCVSDSAGDQVYAAPGTYTVVYISPYTGTLIYKDQPVPTTGAGAVASAQGTAPIEVNGTTGQPQTGAITVSTSYVNQTNGTNNLSQTLLNFTDSSTVKFTNPSGGIEEANVIGSSSGNYASLVTQPTTGQMIFVRPTGFTPASNPPPIAQCTSPAPVFPSGYVLSPPAGGPYNSAFFTAGSCGNNLAPDSEGGTWTFTGALEKYGLTQAQVTHVYGAEMISSAEWGTAAITGSCGGGNLYLADGTYLGQLFGVPPVNFTLQQATTSDLGTSTGVDSLTCTTTASHAFVNGGGQIFTSVTDVGFWVEYTGTPVTTPSTVNFAAPLGWYGALNSVWLQLPYDIAADAGSAANVYKADIPGFIPPGQAANYAPTAQTHFWLFANNANTGASTLTFNGYGPVNIEKNVNGSLVALAANDIVTSEPAQLMYTGSVWVLENPATSPISGMTAGQVAIAGSGTTITSSKAIQGTDTNLLSSGTVSGTGATLCTDASGGATTSGCTAAVGTITPSLQYQIPYYSASGTSSTLTGDSGMTTDGSGNATFKSLATTGTAGVGGAANFTEGTAATAAAGHDIIYADSTAHCLELSNNGAAFACIGSGGGSITLTTTGTSDAATYSSGTLNVPIYVKEDTNYNSFVADGGPSGGINPPVGTIGNDLFWGNAAGLNVGNYTAVNTTGTAASGSTTLTIASATGVYQYMNVTGAGIPTGDTVASITGTTVTLATATTAALSSTPVSFYPGNTNGSIGIGRWALENMVAGNGMVAVGTGAFQNYVTDNTGGEDGNSVAIGPYAGSGQTGSGCAYGQLFESTFIGNKVDNDACGAADTQEIGNHIYGFWNITDSFIAGGEVGTQGTGIYIEPNRVQMIGDGNFNPGRSGNGTVPAGTYTPANENIFGSISGQNLYNTHDNNILGTNSFDTLGATSPATATWDNVIGNSIANYISSGSYDTCIGGWDGGSNPTCGALTTGSYNIAIGTGAFKSATTSANSVAIGYDAATYEVSNSITSVGDGSCGQATGGGMMCFGTWAGAQITTGTNDVVIGSATNSGGSGPSGAASSDVYVGSFSGQFETSNQNVGIGNNADRRTTSSLGNNTAVGYGEFLSLTGSAGNEQYNTFAGENSTCNACTYAVSLGQAAQIGTTHSTTATASSGSTSLTVASASNMAVGQYIAGAGIPAQDTITNISGTTITISTATTAALSSTAVYFTTPVAHAVQIDSGTNNTSNTVQYQSWNFLDSSGNVHQNLTVEPVGTAIASAATIAPVAPITHITGTAAISTITPPTVKVNGGTYTGCLKFIPDGAFTLATGGNIGKASTAVVGQLMTVCYDGTTWYPSY